MIKKVMVEVSNHHVHLTKEVYNELFDTSLEKKNELSQKGEFSSNKTVELKTDKGSIKKVRIVGPFRNYNQVEISKSDARLLGLNPPVSRSGNLSKSESITLVGKKGKVTLPECCILASRHIHMNNEIAENLNVVDNQIVKVLVSGDRAAILYAKIKISENGVLAFHIDTDEANALLLNQGDMVDVVF